MNDFSSKLDLPLALETVESIDANHMQMTRCSSRDDQGYRAISGVLKAYVRQELDSQRTPSAVDEGVAGGRLFYDKPKHDWSLDVGYALGRWLAAQCLEQDVLAMYANLDPNGHDPLVISADRFHHACCNGGIESSLSPRKEAQWRQQEAKEKVWKMLRTECSINHLVFAIIAVAFALMDVHDENTWGPAAKEIFRSLAERELKAIPVECGIDLRMLWIRITKTAKHNPEYLEGFVMEGAC